VSLIRIAKLKLAARALGVRRLDLGPQGGSVLFEERTAVDPAGLVRLIQKSAREYRLDGPQKLRVSRQLPTDNARFEYAGDLLGRLAAAARPAPDG
jgi:transcription-repair coupling factor (superfamily II helicase)